MITDKVTHLFNFNKDKSTSSDLLANSVVLNTNLVNQRSTDLDAYAPYVTLNLRFDQIPACYFFSDDCGNLITRSGTPSVSSTVTRNGYPALYFDGSNSYLIVTYSSELNLQGTDFTVEGWAQVNNSTLAADLIDFRGSTSGTVNWVIGVSTTNWRFYVWDGAAGNVYHYAPNNSISQSTWFHFAVCSTNNICTVYINGISVLSFSWITPATSTTGVRLGTNSSDLNDLLGYLSDIRITRGVSRYTSNFTPPVSIPEITPRGPRIYDQILGDCYSMGSQGPSLDYTAGPFGEPALYFNGSTFLTIPYHRYFNLFSQYSAFTVELWFKIERDPALSASTFRSGTLISFGWPDSGSFTNGVSFRISGIAQTGGGLEIEYQTATMNWGFGWSAPIEKDTWHHVAFCKESNKGFISAYLDGKLLRSQDVLQNNPISFPTTLPIKIGSDNFTGSLRTFIGWMSNIRITKECRYFGDFITPTTESDSGDPYLADTTLLMKFNDTAKTPLFGLTNDIKAHLITQSGDVNLASGGKFGDTCAYFDGVGTERLAVAYNADYDVSTGAFTLEFWYKPQSITASQLIVDWRPTNNTVGFAVYQGSSTPTKISASFGDSTAGWDASLISQTTLQVGVWYHVAVTRSSNNEFGLWINGALESVSNWSGTIYINSNPMWLGIARDGTSSPLNAYIDNFRLTKGVSRYSISFDSSPDAADAATKLLLNFNGSNGSTTFTDSSFYNHTVSVFGNAQLSTTVKKFGSASGYFDGAGDYITVPYTQFSLQNDWSVDFWINPSVLNLQRGIIGFRQGNDYVTPLQINLSSAGGINVGVPSGSAWTVNISSTRLLLAGVWSHVTVQRISNDFEIYINGILDTRNTTTLIPNSAAYDLKIATDPGLGNYYQGYLDDIRIIDGKSSISQSFTAPSSAYEDSGYKTLLLLHFDGTDGSTNVVDECGNPIGVYGNAAISTTQSKFGGSSAYFDGTSDYLIVSTTADIRLGNSFDHTIEMWVYPTVDSPSYKTLFYIPSAALYQKNATFLWYEGAERCISSNVTMNEWHHVAVVRVGSTVDLYVDGVKSGSSHTSVLFFSTSYIYIGCNSAGGEPFTGYIDEVRYVRGRAYYTSIFTPPTNPFTIDSSGDPFFPDTVLLMHMNGTDDSTTFTDVKGSTITPFGDAKIKTTQSKFGGASAYFDGNGDYLRLPWTSAFDLSSKDFSVEAWVYPLSTSGSQYIIGSGSDWTIILTQTTLTCYSNSASVNLTVTVPPFQTNTWYHIALVRISGYNMFFVDGIMYGYNTMGITDASRSYIYIGCQSYNSRDLFFNGYIDEVRITRNVYQHLPYLPPALERTFQDPYWANTVLMIPFTGTNGSTTFLDWKGKTISVYGNTQISTAQSKYGGSSGLFDGASDYLRIEDHADFDFGAGDFTIEFYAYFNSVSGSYWGLVQKRWNNNNQLSFCIWGRNH